MNIFGCSMCNTPYRIAPDHFNRAFCPACLGRLTADAMAAETHMARIKNGDMKAVPDNETQRNIRDLERRRQVRALT